jgi:hypothetical protein
MPETISVSPAQPDKLVVNGCDLLNREELSASQNRELQRYIDANAHLLGFLDKSKEEEVTLFDPKKGYSLGGRYSGLGSGISDGTDLNRSKYGGGDENGYLGQRHYEMHPLNRVGSPSSDYGWKNRKGVSFADTPSAQRARSHSPPGTGGRESDPTREYRDDSGYSSLGRNRDTASSGFFPDNYPRDATDTTANIRQNGIGGREEARPYSPSYSTSDKRRTPYNPYGSRIESPWGDTIRRRRGSKDSLRSNESSMSGWKGFPKSTESSAYSTLERHPDDYNKYETHRYREQQHRKSVERDETKKFYGFGDHIVSGIELKPRPWTGGEIVTDPDLIKKSLKSIQPRTFYYSPIGDGVVAADGVEMKRGPPDLAPRISVIHQRYVEKVPGQPGHRVYERLWDEGGRGGDDGDAFGDRGRFPPRNNDLGNDDAGHTPYPSLGRGGKEGPDDGKRPYGDGDGLGKGGEYPYDNKGGLGDGDRGRGLPYGSGKFPDDGGDGFGTPRSRPDSALSLGSDGRPREGWTKTFITNPRELINQYGTETNINIFDLEDHTPKTITTIRETISPAPANI